MHSRSLAGKKELLVFLLILFIAVFFRTYKLDSFPPGLYPDEAMNGNNALEAINTCNYKIFYPENNGREGLFINLQALSLQIFGINPWALRAVSALIGILTVAGLYLLTKELFEWRLAGIASFLMAISFWHVNFSRIGFRAIMLPLILVYGFYFLWKGLKSNHLFDFIIAGIFGGLGFYTYTSYRVAPLIAIILFANYWWVANKDLSLLRYNEAKARLLKNFFIFILTTFIIALPIGSYFLTHHGSFNSRTGQNLLVFSQQQPLKTFATSIIRTLGMFTFSGDYNQRHNISGEPMLPWPIGIFFAIGFINELIHWLKRKHGHFSTVHTFIFSWFFVMLLPGFLSIEAPHALRTIGVIPIVMLITAKGLWWSFEKIKLWYASYYPYKKRYEIYSVVNVVTILFLISLGFLEFSRYFTTWGPSRATAEAFNQNYVDLGNKINKMPVNIKKYVLVNAPGTWVNGIPMPSQTIMFVTDTYTKGKQQTKNIFYLTPQQFSQGQYDRQGIIIKLE